jgi:hypothetical protein
MGKCCLQPLPIGNHLLGQLNASRLDSFPFVRTNTGVKTESINVQH